jgi:hypothetical protein
LFKQRVAAVVGSSAHPPPTSPIRAASSTWLRFSTPGRARSSAMRSVDPWAPASPSRH